MENVTEATTEVEIIDQKLKDAVRVKFDRVGELIVSDADSYREGTTVCRELKADRAVIVAKFKPIKQSIDASKKKVLDLEKELLGPIDVRLEVGRNKLLTWKLAEEAKAKADLELQRKIAEDKARKAREAEEARRKKEAEEKAEAERVAQAEDVERLRKAGLSKEADKMAGIEVIEVEPEPVDEADFVPEVIEEKPAAKIAGGAGTQKRWKARVTDKRALCRAVGASEHLDLYVDANMKSLHALAVQMRQPDSGIDGVEFFQDANLKL